MTSKKNISSQMKEIDLPSRIRNFYKRWNFEADDAENSRKFKNRILIAVDRIVGDYLLSNPAVSNEYAFLLGYDLPPSSVTGDYNFDALLIGVKFEDDPVYKILSGATEFEDFIIALQALFWMLEKYECPHLEELADQVRLAIEYSPNISLRIVKKNGAVTLYPGGAKSLDEKLVNESLIWLESKPFVLKHYEQALSIYLSKEESKYRNLLDNLRLALEQLLRALLGNRKSLENQKSYLLAWLKKRGAHPQVINMYNDLLARFIQYQNDAVKHGDKWSNFEIEFMIYLTGVFMRFLLELEQQA